MLRVVVASLVLAAATVAAAQPAAKKPGLDSGGLTAAEVVGLVDTLTDDPSRFDDAGGAVVAKTVIVGGPWAALGIRVGDTVLAINGMETRTAAELRSALLMAHYGRVLYVELVRKKKPVLLRRVVAGTSPPAATAAALEEAALDEAERLDALIDTSITRIDATTVEVTDTLIDRVLADPIAVAKGARVMPHSVNGVASGFKLYAIRPSSIFARIGFTNGDRLTAVNGIELTGMDRALEVYALVRDADRVTIEVVRRGKPITLTIIRRK